VPDRKSSKEEKKNQLKKKGEKVKIFICCHSRQAIMGFSLKHRAGSFMVVAIFLLGKCSVFLEFFSLLFLCFCFWFCLYLLVFGW
jgi:hypothetical protein